MATTDVKNPLDRLRDQDTRNRRDALAAVKFGLAQVSGADLIQLMEELHTLLAPYASKTRS
jgi:hypothetical protein